MADCSKEFAAATCRAFGGRRDSPSHGLRAVLTAQVAPAPSLALSRRAYSGRSRTRLLRLPASTIRFHRRTCLAFRPASSLGARSVARPRGERGDTGPAGPPGEAGNSNLRAFDVDEDIASSRAAAVVTLSAKVKSRTRVFGGGCLPYDRCASRSHPPNTQDRSVMRPVPFGPAATMIRNRKIRDDRQDSDPAHSGIGPG